MRIILAADFYRPFIGGAERQTELLAHELATRDHKVGVATVWQPDLPLAQEVDGVSVRRLRALSTLVPWFSRDPGRRFHPPWPDPAVALAFRRFARRFRPDVVQSWGWMSYSVAAGLVGTKIPLVISSRDYAHSCATRALMYRGRVVCDGPALGKCLRCASGVYGEVKAIGAVTGVLANRPFLRNSAAAIHSVSRYVESVDVRDVLEWDARAPRRDHPLLRVIPSFLEDSVVQAVVGDEADAPAYLPAEPFILFVGALQHHKGLTVLLDAYSRLSDPPRLVLIGTIWPDTPSLPSSVTVLSDVPHPGVMASWRRSMFGVAPSLWPEPSAGVIREAMSQGRPVIGTTVGGTPELIVDGTSGLLVPPDDPEQLARAMEFLIVHPRQREQMGANARAAMGGYAANRVVPQFEALYRDVLSQARS